VDRNTKHELVAQLNESLLDSGVLVVTHYKGLTVAEATALRLNVRNAGAQFKVIKNTLARIALRGTPFESAEELFKGPTGIAFSKDPVAAAKVVADFAKTNEKLVIIGGALGQRALSSKEVEALAKMPSLDELRGKLIGLINAPATKVAGVLQAPAGQLARVFSAYSKK
jgi:large subunit ribosomal protein L10